jgi:opacity protein-like surface antigen
MFKCRVIPAIAAALFTYGASSVSAQTAAQTTTTPTYELSAGYQLTHVPDQTLPLGVAVDGAWNYSSRLGLVGEIGWSHKSDDDAGVDTSLSLWHFGAGPRFNLRNNPRFVPYAQVLAGAVHARSKVEIGNNEAKDSATRFMLQPGVGVNVIAGDGWGVFGAVDYRRVFLDEDEDGDSGENDFRIFVGLRMILD